MKKPFLLSATTLLLAFGAQAQSTNPALPPGELAVLKAGDNTGVWNISSSKVQPCFVQVFDTVTNNQSSPLMSIPLPTNGSTALWINAHAGSEGGGISRTINREFLAMEGYTGNILSPSDPNKPSANTSVSRGIVTLDAFTNLTSIYSDLANWFGLPPGVTQNNPTGIASTDGTNFWGTGNFAGTAFEASGVLFYNGNYSSTPVELENYIQSAGEARIIGGVLYIVVPGSGVFNFLDPDNNDAVVPLPYDPNVPNPVQHIVLTNLFLNWGTTFKNVANFDMNSAGTIAYGADETFGVVKFTNNAGTWQQAYLFNSNNIGTAKQKASTQGCFGICVDFSGANPVIYATTMETGTSPVNNSQGNPNQNRLIRIVDSGNPGTNLVAQTLATATSTNENFRGVDFTPDLRPLVTSAPANYSTTNGGSASFSVGADSVFPLSYQWLQNGLVLGGATSPTLTLSGLDTSFNSFTYACIVSNQYGAVTSAPATLTVTLTAQPPVITGSAQSVIAFVGGTETFAPVTPSSGTQPFSFQWYFGTTQLVDDGVKYSGSTTASLSVSNLTSADTGSYYLVAANSAGFASNKVDILTVNYHLPAITTGEPASLTVFAGGSTSITATSSGGNPPITNQWYKGTTALSDGNEYSGTQTSTLTINPAALSDAGSYKIVISNPGGSVTSAVATVTVLVPPPHSQVSYSNQVYLQNFNSLPDPGSNSVNSFNNPMDPGNLVTGGATNSYSLANPFDFAYPIINQSFVGGLGLSNTMQGWYGAADMVFPGVDGITRFGAQDGDQTTGGVIDFGPNDNGGVNGTNRALGLLSTSTTGSTTYALKLVNTSANPLNYISLSFIGELWHNGTGQRTMSFGYTLDPTANSFTLTSQSISNSTLVPGLNFSFPTASQVTAVDGTQPAYQVDMATNNLALASQWQPGAALWLIWAIDYYGSGSGNGYAIDNLYFHASVNPTSAATSPLILNNMVHVNGGGLTFNFTNAPNAVFTVQYTTSLKSPVNWQTLGTPTETPNGMFSTYSFTDTQAGAGARFYRVVSH